MQLFVRARAVVALAALLPAALSACDWSGFAEDDPDKCQHDAFPCSPGPMCNGQVAGYCDTIDHNCHVFAATLDCRDVGATCLNGSCAWSEACPLGTDALCRNGHVLECENGAFVRAHECSSATPCQETLSEDGRTHAACAYLEETCAHTDASSVECRDNARIECNYGLVTGRYDCGINTCTPIDAPTGEHLATCALAGPGCVSTAKRAVECRGNVRVSCMYGVLDWSIECARSGEVCRSDIGSECWPEN